MMERAKVIRRRSWLFELLICLELLSIMGAWWWLTGSWMAGILFGECFYLVLAWTLRLTLQRHHRRGMRLMRRQNYEEALAAFEESFRFFTKYPWIDRYRFVTMFASSALSYQQMALNNQGFCLLCMGRDAQALEVFQRLREINEHYPNISMLIDMIQKKLAEETSQ